MKAKAIFYFFAACLGIVLIRELAAPSAEEMVSQVRFECHKCRLLKALQEACGISTPIQK